MIPEIGHLALLLAFFMAVVQSIVPLIGASRDNGPMMSSARALSQGQFVFIAIAFAALTWSYVVSDFSVANVAANSHSAKPFLYKLTGVWGNHEGSMLLWVLILALFGAVLGSFGNNLPPQLRARALSVQAMIAVGFLAFTIFTSNPFERLSPVPADGNGLNPVLQDPGLAFHPPFLYLGYVGFSMAFSFAVAALIEGRVDAAWARWVRPWTLAAWSFLTVGIALGSWWAYYELGWGGWWFWDPVENASFMPWLVGTALLHSAIVVEKRDALKSWTVLLAILTFGFSLLGAFLVRSGVLTSVHSFASDPDRGVFILALLAIAIGGSLTLYAIRAPALKGGGLFRPFSREGGMVFNNLILTTATITVLLGTLYPLFLDIVGGGKISVGPPYFNATFVPLMLPLLVAVAIGPLLAWKRADMWAALSRLFPAMLGAVIMGAIVLYLGGSGAAMAALGLAIALWLILGAIIEITERIKLFRAPLRDSLRRARGLPRATWGMTIAHSALGIMVAGITASSAWQIERIQTMRPGDTVNVAGYNLKFEGVRITRGSNYRAQTATLTVTRDGKPVTVLTPEKRAFPVQRQTTTEAAIHTTFFADLYAVLGEPDDKGGWAVRLYYNPLVPWIWGGAILMFLGGMVSLTDRRHRVGAPRRSKARTASAASSGASASAGT